MQRTTLARIRQAGARFAGGRLVWVVWLRWRQVDVWHSGDTAPTPLNVGDVLGFTYPVADLFG